jgi:hypothetical protein
MSSTIRRHPQACACGAVEAWRGAVSTRWAGHALGVAWASRPHATTSRGIEGALPDGFSEPADVRALCPTATLSIVVTPNGTLLRQLTQQSHDLLDAGGDSAGSPELLLRPSPATDRDAAILDVEDPYFGYDAETCPSQQPQRTVRSTSRAGPLGGRCGNISRDSRVRRHVNLGRTNERRKAMGDL